MTRPYTLEQLRRATLRRQFPAVRGRGPAAVVDLVRRVGPIQSQAPRAPFVGIAARLPGVDHAAIAAAFEAYDIVKGSNIRGTVHVCVRDHFPLLDAVTRRTVAASWRNGLRLQRHDVDDLRAEIERWIGDDWRLESDLTDHMTDWLGTHESAESAAASKESHGRFILRGYSALIRRPSNAAWEKRSPWMLHHGPPLLGTEVVEADAALAALARVHIASYGPSTRHDIAWWSGEGLTRIDAAVAALGDEIVARPGPDGATYLDLADPPRGGRPEPGLRLLPEFDALVLGYHPRGRTRFLDEAHVEWIWNRTNGIFSSAVLYDGQLVALWRLVGSGRRRDFEVWPLPGEAAPPERELAEPVDGLARAMAVEVREIRVRDTSAG
jgi:Winged helix DNA-binding domain